MAPARRYHIVTVSLGLIGLACAGAFAYAYWIRENAIPLYSFLEGGLAGVLWTVVWLRMRRAAAVE